MADEGVWETRSKSVLTLKVPLKGLEDIWTVIYVAPNRVAAETLKTLLTREGFLVQLKAGGPFHLGDQAPVEVLVPASEVEEATEVLAGSLGK